MEMYEQLLESAAYYARKESQKPSFRASLKEIDQSNHYKTLAEGFEQYFAYSESVIGQGGKPYSRFNRDVLSTKIVRALHPGMGRQPLSGPELMVLKNALEHIARTAKSERVIIAGCRDYDDYKTLHEECERILTAKREQAGDEVHVSVLSGGATGADALGERYAAERGLQVLRFPADWDTHGNAAGPIRNRQMAENATMLIAFWDGESRGTKNMIDEARAHGFEAFVKKIPSRKHSYASGVNGSATTQLEWLLPEGVKLTDLRTGASRHPGQEWLNCKVNNIEVFGLLSVQDTQLVKAGKITLEDAFLRTEYLRQRLKDVTGKAAVPRHPVAAPEESKAEQQETDSGQQLQPTPDEVLLASQPRIFPPLKF